MSARTPPFQTPSEYVHLNNPSNSGMVYGAGGVYVEPGFYATGFFIPTGANNVTHTTPDEHSSHHNGMWEHSGPNLWQYNQGGAGWEHSGPNLWQYNQGGAGWEHEAHMQWDNATRMGWGNMGHMGWNNAQAFDGATPEWEYQPDDWRNATHHESPTWVECVATTAAGNDFGGASPQVTPPCVPSGPSGCTASSTFPLPVVDSFSTTIPLPTPSTPHASTSQSDVQLATETPHPITISRPPRPILAEEENNATLGLECAHIAGDNGVSELPATTVSSPDHVPFTTSTTEPTDPESPVASPASGRADSPALSAPDQAHIQVTTGSGGVSPTITRVDTDSSHSEPRQDNPMSFQTNGEFVASPSDQLLRECRLYALDDLDKAMAEQIYLRSEEGLVLAVLTHEEEGAPPTIEATLDAMNNFGELIQLLDCFGLTYGAVMIRLPHAHLPGSCWRRTTKNTVSRNLKPLISHQRRYTAADARMGIVNVHVWRQEGTLSKFQDKLDKKSAEIVDIRRFWENLPADKARGEATKYAVDLPYDWFNHDKSVMQLFTEPFNLLNRSSAKTAGVHTPYVYAGSPGSIFTWHVEDVHLYSGNYHLEGGEKTWFVIPAGDKEAFENAIIGTFYLYPLQTQLLTLSYSYPYDYKALVLTACGI